MDASEIKAYLERQLQLDPATAAAQIVASRNRLWGLKEYTDGVAIDHAEIASARAVAMRQLSDIRETFWKMPAADCNTALEKIRVEDLPDLKVSVARLSHLNSLRERFTALAQEDNVDPSLLDFIKWILVLPLDEANQMRMQVWSKTGGTKATRKTIRVISKSYPEVLRLDATWFNQLYNSFDA